MHGKKVIAIGMFDGVHLGHRRILERAVKIARRFNTSAIAVTFDPHPASVLDPKKAPPYLISLRHRLRLMHDIGIDRCVVFNFTKEFARISAESFIKNILIKRLNAGWIVAGEDFYFGRGRHADVDFLKKEGKKLGLATVQLKTLKYKGVSISSSLIRRLICRGRLNFAQRLIGRPVTILGNVVKGSSIGKAIGFPTANVNPHHEVVPPSGVYAVFIIIGKNCYRGVLNIGVRPTFYGIKKQDEEPTIEVHIFNFSKKIYGRNIEVLFVKKMRSEKGFVDKEALAVQIRRDAQKAKKILKEAECNSI